MLLCNESFAATNESEGSEIAREIVRPLTEGGVRVLFVTHLYELAHSFYREAAETTLFLRAERAEDGRRSFRLPPGEPLPTSFGEDVYRRVFDGAETNSEVSDGARRAA
jgi:DNA mismatch repair ATPase MutS